MLNDDLNRIHKEPSSATRQQGQTMNIITFASAGSAITDIDDGSEQGWPSARPTMSESAKSKTGDPASQS